MDCKILVLKTKFYEMENVSRMERVEVACDSYRAKHGLGDGILNSEEEGSGEEGSGEDEVEEDTYEEIVSQTDDDEDKDNHDDE